MIMVMSAVDVMVLALPYMIVGTLDPEQLKEVRSEGHARVVKM